MLVETVAKKLEIEPQTLERESLRLFLTQRLRLVEAERLALCTRYDVSSVEEMDEAIRQGKIHEEEGFEDYFTLDHLEHTRDRLLDALKDVQ